MSCWRTNGCRVAATIHGLVFGVLLLGCAQISNDVSYNVQTDGAMSRLPQGAMPLAVLGDSPAIVGAATTWLQKRGMAIIERSRLDQVFTEQKIRLTSTPDREADLLRAGQLAGAKILVFADGTARPGQFGNASVTIRAVDVETAVVVWSGSAQYIGALAYVEYALAGLTCEALATAWGFRPPGMHQLPASGHCQTP